MANLRAIYTLMASTENQKIQHELFVKRSPDMLIGSKVVLSSTRFFHSLCMAIETDDEKNVIASGGCGKKQLLASSQISSCWRNTALMRFVRLERRRHTNKMV